MSTHTNSVTPLSHCLYYDQNLSSNQCVDHLCFTLFASHLLSHFNFMLFFIYFNSPTLVLSPVFVFHLGFFNFGMWGIYIRFWSKRIKIQREKRWFKPCQNGATDANSFNTHTHERLITNANERFLRGIRIYGDIYWGCCTGLFWFYYLLSDWISTGIYTHWREPFA